MRKLAFLFVAFALVAVSFFGCDETKLTEPSAETPGDLAEEAPSQAPLFSSGGGSAVLPFWTTDGNANTNPSSQFLGTLDNQSLAFRTNGAEAMRVTTNGRLGIGTTSPGARLHLRNQGGSLHELLVEETSPGAASIIRVQNAVRNWKLVSDASPDVFQIESGPGSVPRLTIRGSNGNVGIGTNNPQAPLHVVNGTGVQAEMVVQETRAGQAAHFVLRSTARSWWLLSQVNPDRFSITGSAGTTHPFVIRGSDGNVGLGAGDPDYPLEMASGAHVTVGGVWTDASSRAYKENIRDLTTAEAQTALNGLTPVQFNYIADGDEGYVGFIAEDVPELVATQDRKGLGPMDIVAVLTKVVQQQEERIAELEARLDALQ